MRQALGYDMTFQSTLPRRSDLKHLELPKRVHNFNPRSREGATHITMLIMVALIFQSTLPRKAD